MTRRPAEEPGNHPVSHTVNVETLPGKGLNLVLRPGDDERQALADAHDMVGVEDYVAEVNVKRWQRDGIRITGHLQADIVQSCIVSLEPVSQHIDTDIDALFLPETSKLASRRAEGEAQEILIDPDGPDAPEPFEPPYLDVGAAVAEFFSLAIDPYPRAPGVEEPVVLTTDPAGKVEEERPNPFAKLAGLKDKLTDD